MKYTQTQQAKAASELIQARGLIAKALDLCPDMPKQIVANILQASDLLDTEAGALFAMARLVAGE